MLLVTTAALILFWLCDYWLLQLGPSGNIVRRLWFYGALVALAAATVWLAEGNAARFLNLIESPLSLVVLFVFHAGAALVCFWMRRTDRYELAWVVAVIPPPAAWVLFAETVAAPDLDLSEVSKSYLIWFVGAAWVATMALAVQSGRRIQMALKDVDYVVNFAAWVHCFGAGLVVFVISHGVLDSIPKRVEGLLR